MNSIVMELPIQKEEEEESILDSIILKNYKILKQLSKTKIFLNLITIKMMININPI